MPSTYVHLSGRNVDHALLKLNNITVSQKEEAEKDFSLKKCPRCERNNPTANKFCNRYGMVLCDKAARDLMKSNLERTRADKITDMLLQDSEFRVILGRKLEELNRARQGR